MVTTTPKKDTLKTISLDLRKIDFSTYNPSEDKIILLLKLKKINAELGKLLRGFENATS